MHYNYEPNQFNIIILYPIKKTKKTTKRAAMMCAVCLGIIRASNNFANANNIDFNNKSSNFIFAVLLFLSCRPSALHDFVCINRKICFKRILLSNKLFVY